MVLKSVLGRTRRPAINQADLSVNAVTNPSYTSTLLDEETGRRTLLGTGRKGACALLRPSTSSTDEPRTAVVLGIARGGTSMVSGALRGLGVYMGENLGFNHEDSRIQRIVNQQLFGKFANLARKRDAKHDLWGFKFPEASTIMDKFHPNLRNPHYLLVIRNPLSRGMSAVKRTGGDLSASVVEALEKYSSIFSFLDGANAPALAINYEQATIERDETVRQIAEFLGIDPTREVLERATSMIVQEGAGYVNLPEHAFYVTEQDQPSGDAMTTLAASQGRLEKREISYARGRASVWLVPKTGFPKSFWISCELAGRASKPGDCVRLYYDYDGRFHVGHRLLITLKSTKPLLRVDAAEGLKRIAIVPMNDKSAVRNVRIAAAIE